MESVVAPRLFQLSSRADAISFRERGYPLLEKIRQVVMIFIKTISTSLPIVAAAPFLLLSPAFFSVGFLTGVIFDEQSKLAHHKISSAWQRQHWTGNLAIGFGAFMALPVSTVLCSFLISNKIGCQL